MIAASARRHLRNTAAPTATIGPTARTPRNGASFIGDDKKSGHPLIQRKTCCSRELAIPLWTIKAQMRRTPSPATQTIQSTDLLSTVTRPVGVSARVSATAHLMVTRKCFLEGASWSDWGGTDASVPEHT